MPAQTPDQDNSPQTGILQRQEEDLSQEASGYPVYDQEYSQQDYPQEIDQLQIDQNEDLHKEKNRRQGFEQAENWYTKEEGISG